MNTVNWFASNGLFEYGILGGLQIDQWGNFNSGFLGGDYYHPKRRYGGPGGANEIASLCWRTIIITDQEKRKFVKKPDFISSPGYLDGSPNARERAGMPRNTGPYRVVTGKAMFGYDDETHKMKLLAIAPWVKLEDVLAEMDFEPIMPEHLEQMVPPTEEELDILRVAVDPGAQSIAKGEWITF
jgi:glutaconate CoA-transferase subunit B